MIFLFFLSFFYKKLQIMKNFLCFNLILFLFGFGGLSCQSLQPNHEFHPVTHIVLCWLKQAGDLEARQRLIEVSKSFRSIPGVMDVTAGSSIPSKRPQVDSSFDVAVIITFSNREAMAEYENHPLHQKAVREALIPLVKKYIVYDFTNDFQGN